MSLDVFNPAASDQNVAANAAADLPAGFTEAFDISLRSIGEWNSSTAYANARARALAGYYDDVKQKTGVQLPLYGMGGNVSIDELNDGIAKLPQAPDQAPMPPLSEDSINSMALARMAKAHDDSRAFASRETTWGGTAGTVIGTLTAGLADPVTAATAPLGGAGTLPIAVRALEFAAIGAGTEAAIAATNYQSREAAVPGSSKEIPGEIASAGLFGGVLGGAIGALGKVLGHGAKSLPTSVRDEVNAAASDLQFHATNPFPTAAGEAAARDATVDATMALVRDVPVRSADDFAAVHVADYASAAKVTSPDELAIAGERHLRPGTFDDVPDVERFDAMPHEADDAASYWERRVAEAGPEERSALGATDADVPQRAVNLVEDTETAKGEMQKVYTITGPDGEDLGGMIVTKMGDVARIENIEVAEGSNTLGPSNMRSLLRQFREANPEIRELTGERISGARFGGDEVYDGEHIAIKLPEIPARDLTPEQVAKLAADPATESAVLHNLEHIVDANPGMDFTTQIRQADGTYQFTTQKLSDVLADLDGWETAAKEIEACAVGGALEAAE